jgi:hypothetical protein
MTNRIASALSQLLLKLDLLLFVLLGAYVIVPAHLQYQLVNVRARVRDVSVKQAVLATRVPPLTRA